MCLVWGTGGSLRAKSREVLKNEKCKSGSGLEKCRGWEGERFSTGVRVDSDIFQEVKRKCFASRAESVRHLGTRIEYMGPTANKPFTNILQAAPEEAAPG